MRSCLNQYFFFFNDSIKVHCNLSTIGSFQNTHCIWPIRNQSIVMRSSLTSRYVWCESSFSFQSSEKNVDCLLNTSTLLANGEQGEIPSKIKNAKNVLRLKLSPISLPLSVICVVTSRDIHHTDTR